MKLRIATRKSRLALWQAEHVAGRLRDAWPEARVELVPLSTRGDRMLDRPLAEIGGKGLFLKELERAMLEGRADLAVHSLKDVPAEATPGLELPVFLVREQPADAWLSGSAGSPADLPAGARVGTSSLRRQSQLLARRPDLEVASLRGNVETRIRRLDDGDYDAIILAAAGLRRLRLDGRIRSLLEPPEWLPAPGQGVIAVQCRSGDQAVMDAIRPLHCDITAEAAAAERGVIARLGGDCRMPLAAFAHHAGARLVLVARLYSSDGARCADAAGEAVAGDATKLGRDVGEKLLQNGGADILKTLAGDSVL